MCAPMPLTAEVVMLPLTDLSLFTVMVPLPEAEVATGGTSWPPLSVTLLPPNIELHIELMVSHPARASAAATSIAGAAPRKKSDAFIGSSCVDGCFGEKREGHYRAPFEYTCRCAQYSSRWFRRVRVRLSRQACGPIDQERDTVSRRQGENEDDQAAYQSLRNADPIQVTLDEIARDEKCDRREREAEHARIVPGVCQSAATLQACRHSRKGAFLCAEKHRLRRTPDRINQ